MYRLSAAAAAAAAAAAVLLVVCLNTSSTQVITLSWLKKRWPEIYKHVLITNGHWHSHGHFMLQGVRLFWPCIYATCATRLHLLKTIDPAINNLEKNAYMHYTNFIFTVHVASIAFIVNHVTEPPPELFLSNPVCRLGCPLPPPITPTHHHNTTITAAPSQHPAQHPACSAKLLRMEYA